MLGFKNKLSVLTKPVIFVWFILLLCSKNVFSQNLISQDINFISPTGQKTIIEILKEVLNWIVLLGIPIIAIFLILTGIKFLTAHGDESQIREARRMLLYTIIGGLIVLGAFIIINTIREILIKKGFFF